MFITANLAFATFVRRVLGGRCIPNARNCLFILLSNALPFRYETFSGFVCVTVWDAPVLTDLATYSSSLSLILLCTTGITLTPLGEL
jgi:hypothetical protein